MFGDWSGEGYTYVYDSKPSQILPGLFLGTIDQAEKWTGDRLCVREYVDECKIKYRSERWIPVVERWEGVDAKGRHYDKIEAVPKNLDKAADFIDEEFGHGKKLLAHCRAGVNRSPLSIAWWMSRRYGITLDDAYDWIKKQRPIIADRQDFLPRVYRHKVIKRVRGGVSKPVPGPVKPTKKTTQEEVEMTRGDEIGTEILQVEGLTRPEPKPGQYAKARPISVRGADVAEKAARKAAKLAELKVFAEELTRINVKHPRSKRILGF